LIDAAWVAATLTDRLTHAVLLVRGRIYARTGGRVGHRLLAVPCLLLHTVGAKSGAVRTSSLTYAMGDSVRKAYRRRMIAVVALLAPAMSGTPQEQERQAWTLVASIVGAITIARALPPGDEAQAVLDAVLASAMKVVTDVGGTLADPGFS
jgi:hypothetical protein